MSVLAIKLARDIRTSRTRLALMVTALAVALTVAGAMLAMWATASRETTRAYTSTEPASATIVFDKPIELTAMNTIAAAARTEPGVLAATGRTQFVTPIQVNGQDRANPMMVFAAPAGDPMRIVKYNSGSETLWPPGDQDLLIRRDTLALLGINVGDTVTLTPPGAQPVRLRAAATVYDPSLAPSFQEQRGYAYTTLAALGVSTLNQLKIQVTEPGSTTPTRNRDTAVAVTGKLAERLQRAFGVSVEEIQIPQPYAHPHHWQSDVLLLSLLAGGAAALLLATILVAVMLNTLFTQHIPQIGIMKATGARPWVIARYYLTLTLITATAATAIAVPLATFLGQAGVRWLLGLLGIEPVSVAAPWWVYAAIIAAGISLPPLLTAWPLIRTARTTVRAAIDHHGGNTTPGRASQALARLNAVSVLDRSLLLALRNTVRRPARFWLSAGLLASAGAVFVSGLSLVAGTEAIDSERTAARTWDVDIQLKTPATPQSVDTVLTGVAGIERASTWLRTPVSVAETGKLPFTRTYPDLGHGATALATTAPGQPTPKLREGRWLQPGETGAVVLSQIIRDKAVPGLTAGAPIRLFLDGKPTDWRIAGITEERDDSNGGVYTTPEAFAAITGKPVQVNQIRLTTTSHTESDRQNIAAQTEKALTTAGIPVSLAASVTRSNTASSAHLGPVVWILLAVALPMAIIGTIGLAATMSASVIERTREFAVMHAIGALPRTVRGIVVAEGLFLALASCVVAIIPALVLARILGTGLGNLFTNAPLPYRISLTGALAWIVISVLAAYLATQAAATRATRITIREALSHV